MSDALSHPTSKLSAHLSGKTFGYALFVGLLIARLSSYHEIACGCVSIRDSVPLGYTYASCYTYSLGYIIGGGAFYLAFRARRKLPSARLFYLALAFVAVCSVGFYLSLASSLWSVAVGCQLAINIIGSTIVLVLLMGATVFERADQIALLFTALIAFFLFNNLVLPLLMLLSSNMYFLMLGQAAALLAVAIIALAQQSDAVEKDILKRGWNKAVQPRFVNAPPETIACAPQPIIHLVVFSFIIGIMHVEAARLIPEFYNRSIPYGAGTALAVILFYFVLVRRRNEQPRAWTAIGRVMYPLIMVAFILLPSLQSAYLPIPVALIDTSDLFYLTLVVLSCWDIAQQTTMSFFKTIALAFVIKSGAFLAGSVACHVQMALLPINIFLTPYAAAGVCILMVAATFWIGDDHDVRTIWGMRVKLSPKAAQESKLLAQCNTAASAFGLSPKEHEVANLLMLGQDPEDISEQLFISIKTTRTHIHKIYVKTDVHSRKEFENLVKGCTPARR